MPKLIITADIHGNYDAWLTIKSLTGENDSLAVAGDLFDTRYGSFANPAYDPQAIKRSLKSFKSQFYYVYGNCDVSSFFPGYTQELTFTHQSTTISMAHGNRPFAGDNNAELVIQGHTHVAGLQKKGGRIFLNPGSLAAPRNGVYTYAELENRTVRLIELKSGKALAGFDL